MTADFHKTYFIRTLFSHQCCPEYYLFAAEEEILKDHASEIVGVMHRATGVVQGENVLELGAG